MAKLLATNTNYATMITGPTYNQTKLKFIQLSKVEYNKLLIVVVTEGNLIKNSMIDMIDTIGDEELLSLNILLNSTLNGLSINEINLSMITRLKEQAGDHSGVVGAVLEAVAEAIREDSETPDIYTSGATNIFKYPELTDGNKASELISTFEEKEALAEFIANANGENTGIQVYIGNETSVQTMKDCSVVTANYELGDGITGTIGVIGPKRMDYEKVVGTLKTLMEQLDTIYNKE